MYEHVNGLGRQQRGVLPTAPGIEDKMVCPRVCTYRLIGDGMNDERWDMHDSGVRVRVSLSLGVFLKRHGD